MMTDAELWAALAEFARRAGLLGDGQSLAAVGPPPPIDWSKVELVTDSPEIRCEAEQDGQRCVKVRGHEDLHVAPAGAVMIWRKDEPGKRPEFDPRCGEQEWGTNGHRASCVKRAGHRGPHAGVDADGSTMFTWPCPCYPDCTGLEVDHECDIMSSHPTDSRT